MKGYDDLFSTEESRAEAQQERVQEIPLSELHPFEGHPFRVVDDEEMAKTVESVKEYGVLTPAIVRPDPYGGYEIISGHRRHHASELAGKDTMAGGKTIGELMEEMRLKAGAKEYHGHTYMDLARFDEKTRHMIIFDVLTHDSPVGWKGERTRLYLSEVGYQEALENQKKGNIKIISHAVVAKGNLYYDRKEQAR